MTSINEFRDDVETAGERLIRTLPLPHLRRLGLEDVKGGGTGTNPNKPPPPCLDSTCVPCKGLQCIDTIIGHNPLFSVTVAFLIGVVFGLIIARAFRSNSIGAGPRN